MPLFTRWSPGHVTAVVLTIVVPLVLAWWARRDATGRTGCVLAAGFATLLLAESVAKLIWVHATLERAWYDMMPLHLCDFALFACVFAGFTRRQLPYELAYFWGLAGTLQGLITPDLAFGFPAPGFLFFFLSHGGIVGTVLYLTAGMGMRPQWASIRRAYVGLVAYALIAGTFNVFAGTNYGYLRAKPAVRSLLDHLGDWPWYIVSIVIAAVVFFVVLYLPWAITDRLRASRAVTAKAA